MFSIGRRGLLKVGATGVLGAALPATLRAETAHPAKSVIWVHLSGGPSQLDMWDPKPSSPDVIRGEFGSIDTTIPGGSVDPAAVFNGVSGGIEQARDLVDQAGEVAGLAQEFLHANQDTIDQLAAAGGKVRRRTR